MRPFLALLAVGALVPVGVAAATSAARGTWPQFHYSVAHVGVNPREHTLTRANVGRLHAVWTARVPRSGSGIVNSSAAVSADSVYVGNGDGKLYALRRSTGRVRWAAKTGRSIQSSPAVAGGRVYVGSNDGYLYAFRTTNGGRLWRVRTGLLTGSSSPTVVGGVVYVGSLVGVEQSGALYAIDASSGAVRWRADLLSAAAASSPSVVGDTVYIGNTNGNVLAYPTTCETPCKPKWLYELGGGLEIGTPVVADGKIFVSADGEGGSFVYALPASCAAFVCEPIWKADTVTPFTFATPAVSHGVVYTQGYRLYAFDEDCGTGGAFCKPLWVGFARGSSSPAVANGVVYAGSNGGRLYAYAVDCAHGKRICRPRFRSAPVSRGGSTFAASPAVAGGRVYYGAFTTVRAFGLR